MAWPWAVQFSFMPLEPPAVASGMTSPQFLAFGAYVALPSNGLPVWPSWPELRVIAFWETEMRRYGLVTEWVRWQIVTLVATASAVCDMTRPAPMATTAVIAPTAVRFTRTRRSPMHS